MKKIVSVSALLLCANALYGEDGGEQVAPLRITYDAMIADVTDNGKNYGPETTTAMQNYIAFLQRQKAAGQPLNANSVDFHNDMIEVATARGAKLQALTESRTAALLQKEHVKEEQNKKTAAAIVVTANASGAKPQRTLAPATSAAAPAPLTLAATAATLRATPAPTPAPTMVSVATPATPAAANTNKPSTPNGANPAVASAPIVVSAGTVVTKASGCMNQLM